LINFLESFLGKEENDSILLLTGKKLKEIKTSHGIYAKEKHYRDEMPP